MPRKKKAAAAPADAPLIAYKAFDADWSCRDHKFAVGQTYTHDGPVKLCQAGYHAVTVPFDAWHYYWRSQNLARVELRDVSDEPGDDSKVVAASITVTARLTLPEWIKAQAAAVLDLCRTATGMLAATGDGGHAAATGYRAHAAATGDYRHAAATGDCGYAAATGYRAHAAATGYRAHAAATGDYGHAAATGYRGHAAATGDCGHAAATGYRAHAAATGDYGHAAVTGDYGHAAATGYRGHAAATGYRGHAAATGDCGIAVAIGLRGSATAGASGWLVLAAHDDVGQLALVRAIKVGTEGVEPGKAYRLRPDGTPEEVR